MTIKAQDWFYPSSEKRFPKLSNLASREWIEIPETSQAAFFIISSVLIGRTLSE